MTFLNEPGLSFIFSFLFGLSFFFFFFAGTQLNGLKYFYISLTIQLNISHYIQVKDQTLQFLTI